MGYRFNSKKKMSNLSLEIVEEVGVKHAKIEILTRGKKTLYAKRLPLNLLKNRVPVVCSIR